MKSVRPAVAASGSVATERERAGELDVLVNLAERAYTLNYTCPPLLINLAFALPKVAIR